MAHPFIGGSNILMCRGFVPVKNLFFHHGWLPRKLEEGQVLVMAAATCNCTSNDANSLRAGTRKLGIRIASLLLSPRDF